MLIMSFMNSEKEALDLPAIVTGNGEENKCSPKHYGN